MTEAHSRRALRRCLVLGAAAWLANVQGGFAQDPVRASLELVPGGVVGVDERVLLRLKISGLGDRRPSPSFQLENFRIAAGPSRSTSVTILGGVPSNSLTLTWALEPNAVGAARVYGGRLRVGDSLVELPERRVRVAATAPARRRSGRSAAGRDPLDDAFFRRPGALEDRFGRRGPRSPPKRRQARVFLRAEASPANPWVGEQVLYSLHLFTEVDVRSIDPEELPEFHGFWARTVPQPARPEPEIVVHEGRRIYRFVLLQRALFPRRGGTFDIPPVEVTMDALLQDTLGSVLARPRRVSRASNAVTVAVRDLPPAPAGFPGAVGQLSLAARLTPRELEVGDAATLTLTLSGRGHLQGIAPPELPGLPGIEIFPPQQQSDETLRGRRVSGTRTWSYVLVPQRAGDWRLPAIEIPYFDPQRETYRVARADGLSLTVLGAAADAGAGEPAPRTAAVHPIRTAALPKIAGSGLRWHRARPWLFAVPWGVAVLLLGWRLFAAGGPGARQSRRELLARLEAAADDERPRQGAVRMEDAWRDFLHQRWSVPREAPSSRWGALLAERGLRRERTEEVTRLARDLHYLRYAPELSSTGELRGELVGRSGKLVRALR